MERICYLSIEIGSPRPTAMFVRHGCKKRGAHSVSPHESDPRGSQGRGYGGPYGESL